MRGSSDLQRYLLFIPKSSLLVSSLSIDNVNTDATAPPQAARFILRIPRFESAQVENQIATLSFLKQRTQIPIPEIVLFDLTPENAIDSPYTVQLRISGLDLQTGYQTLSHAQRCSFVRQFARVWLDLQAVISPIAGHVYIPREDLSVGFPAPLGQIKVSHLRLESPGEASEAIMNTLKTQNPLDMLLFQFRRWSDLHRKSAPNSRIIPNYFTKLGTVAEEMDARGCFGESDMVLCHTDLSPRNIMVEAAPDGSLRICGILDWDEAVFGPRVMSCAPPSWIWQWCEDGEEDEATARLEPQDPQLRELKSIFEEEVGQDLLNLAYLPHHRLARRLCDFVLYEISCKEHMDNADRLSAEWQQLKLKMEGAQG
ncbi:hypothetical protein D8B26_005561 [Coccidioides posadasii str. Silveira]|uniref:Aminoglycoside phosphotransferase domain-containing protein n=1 Tax=Coccidioides posadasii (strain RMSCC 757 / Silveira) TaxID=443226 RepID=E9D3V0_COCPS|nr:conserved hypothetical protein [Coccidioides posadasii str. Silveira]QVM10909.1 hypothetical protein D8B26_005561 [Coccidioides posadasii str. Silveira]